METAIKVVIKNLFPREDRDPLRANLEAALAAAGLAETSITFTDPGLHGGDVSPLILVDVEPDGTEFAPEVKAVIEGAFREAKHPYHLVRKIEARPGSFPTSPPAEFAGMTG